MKTTVSSDGVARPGGPTDWPDGATVPVWYVGQTGTRAGAQRRADGHPSGADGCPTEGGSRGVAQRRVSGGVPTVGLGGGPTGDYIRVPAPHFWALSSSA
jgi:hypothetical protein